MTKTTIEWCDEVWNPVTGCQKVSAGCKNCYAERIASRFWGARKFTDMMIHPERLDDPLHWKKPRRVFVNSMSDLFHPAVPDEFIDRVGQTISRCKVPHTFIVLTKRSGRMREYFTDRGNFAKNVFLGVSVEDNNQLWRVVDLLQTPAAVRFVSVEPMLEAIDLREPLSGYPVQTSSGMTISREMALDAGEPSWEGMTWGDDEWEPTMPALDWVICGCESGPGARPFEMDWARDLRDQCVSANVPFFFKQGRVNGDIVKMPELDGQTWAQYPEIRHA